MHRNDVIHALREHTADIQDFGALSMNLFGSVAHDEAGHDSDIDLFIDYAPDGEFTVIELLQLKRYLADVLGTEVDLTTRDGLHPLLRDEIIQSAVKVF
ncbi:MAG TPA: DNA polymerase III subunit beta [Rhodospirillales bacterium]|nr:DNA polymerase III subunit beta [Rhodospirillales bacterium]